MRLDDMALISCIELDATTVQLTVRERWLERRWFRTFVTETVKSYVLALHVERWLDGDRYVLRPDPRHMRLCELWAAWRIEEKFNRTTGLPMSAPLLDS